MKRAEAVDAELCAVLRNHIFDKQDAYRKADKLASLFRQVHVELVRSLKQGQKVRFDDSIFYSHLSSTIFSRAMVYWKEIGLSNEQLLGLIEVSKAFRTDYIAWASGERNKLVDDINRIIAKKDFDLDSALAAADKLADSYGSIFKHGIDAFFNGHKIFSEKQFEKLVEIHDQELSSNLFGNTQEKSSKSPLSN